MYKSSQNKQNQSIDADALSTICITVSKDGRPEVFCEWESSEDGLSSMANIISYFSEDEMSPHIIETIKSQSSDDSMDEVEKIELMYTAIRAVKKNNNQVSSDQVVVSPIDASSIF